MNVLMAMTTCMEHHKSITGVSTFRSYTTVDNKMSHKNRVYLASEIILWSPKHSNFSTYNGNPLWSEQFTMVMFGLHTSIKCGLKLPTEIFPISVIIKVIINPIKYHFNRLTILITSYNLMNSFVHFFFSEAITKNT